jgi:hypothetical protein
MCQKQVSPHNFVFNIILIIDLVYDRIVRAFLIEEEKIVAKVLKAQQATQPAAK